ncbi:hypothetical protein JCM33374_g3660 [Metschnikowia sp. JCM 33374]|nr:hypothetical protein JCM33374_g3660 [Metschnikowia sp. JCM 33374]
MPRVGIIGGSYAGLKALSTVFNTCKSPNLQVTLVAPSTHAYYNLASPRLLSEPESFDKTVFPVKDFVKEISEDKGTFLHGSVTNVDLDKREVVVKSIAGEISKLNYDILVIASGTEAKWAGYKVNTDYREARKEIYEVNKALQNAKSVAIVGGGVTGVETAGEISAEFEQTKVTLYTGAPAPLDGVVSSLSDRAARKLEALGVEIINDVLVNVKHKNQDGADASSIVFDSGETREYDVILESFLTGPYSSFLPESVKDNKGFVVADSNLEVKGQRGVVALGDIVAGSSKSVVDLKYGQIGIFRDTMEKMFKEVEKPDFLTKPETPQNTDSHYVPITHTMVVPISRKGGVGILYWAPLTSFMVWVGKARTYMIEQARAQFM